MQYLAKAVQDGDLDQRRDFSIKLLNDKGDADKPLAEWKFRDGWPTKWTGPSLNATGNDIAIESLEIAHEGFSDEDPPVSYNNLQ